MSEIQAQFIHNNDDSFTVPAGRYLLGDPCYFTDTSEKHWDRFLDTGVEFKDGIYGILDGCVTLMFNTKYGDGAYSIHDDGRTQATLAMKLGDISVDSGNIGIIRTDSEVSEGLFELIFAEPATCFAEDSLLSFGHIRVETAPSYEYDENYENEDDDEPDTKEENSHSI